jgi:hypothetical protein
VGLFGFSVTLWEKNEEHVRGDFAGKGEARPCFRLVWFNWKTWIFHMQIKIIGAESLGLRGLCMPRSLTATSSVELLQGSSMRSGVKEGAKVYAFVVLAGLENGPLQSDGGEQGGDEGHENQG